MQWETVNFFGWHIPQSRERFYKRFCKEFHVKKWTANLHAGFDIQDLVKFMNGDSSYNNGIHANYPGFSEFYPYFDHAVAFQGDKAWQRVLTCGDYTSVDNELDFAEEFATSYGLKACVCSYNHWRNEDMVLTAFTTQKYLNYLVEKYDEFFSTLGCINSKHTIKIGNPNKCIKGTVPELLKRASACYVGGKATIGNQFYPFSFETNNYDGTNSHLVPSYER